MLATIREFGLELLEASGEREAVRRLHAGWCVDLAGRAEAARVAGEPGESWLDRLELEHDNLRAALDWLKQSGDAPGLLRLSGFLGWFWFYRSHRAEGRTWLERALTPAGLDAFPPDRARALQGLGTIALFRGEYEYATAVTEESLSLSRALGDTWSSAMALNLLGAIARGQGRLDEAVPLLEEAIGHLRLLGDEARLALATCNLGILAHWRGDPEQATALLEEALARYRRLDDAWGITVVASDLGLVTLDRGDARRAAELFAESCVRWQAVGTKEVLADWLARVATFAATIGRAVDAAVLFGAAVALRETIGYTPESVELARYDRALAGLRTLGEERLAGELAAGRALPLEAARARATALLEVAADAPGASGRASAARADAAPYDLSVRELEVLRHLADGHSDREIAELLSISPKTAMRHVANIYLKMGVHSRAAATSLAFREGIV
jgi:non-specific serine/threonine protein kinase